MNCTSDEALALSYTAGAIGSCLVYAEVLKLHGGPWLDCYQYKPLIGRSRNRDHGADARVPNHRYRRRPGNNASSFTESLIDGVGPQGQGKEIRLGATPTSLHHSPGEPVRAAIVDETDGVIITPAQCEWVERISACDVCRSAVCDNCAGCSRDKRSAKCKPCWESFAPCLPSCFDRGCYDQ